MQNVFFLCVWVRLIILSVKNCIYPKLVSFFCRSVFPVRDNLRELNRNSNYKNRVTAILFVLDVTECQTQTGIRLSWQWQVGAVSGKALFSFWSIQRFRKGSGILHGFFLFGFEIFLIRASCSILITYYFLKMKNCTPSSTNRSQ